MTILSIDGGKNVGYALFSDKGEEIERGVIDFDTFFDLGWETGPFTIDEGGWMYFKGRGINRIIVEGFRHDPNVKQGGSLHWASQVEGAVKMIHTLTGLPIHVQYAGEALPVAKQITGYAGDLTKTGNKKHLPDEDSAWLHGIYWLHCNEII